MALVMLFNFSVVLGTMLLLLSSKKIVNYVTAQVSATTEI